MPTPEQLEVRLTNLLETCTYVVFNYTRRGLFDRDKLIVLTLLTFQIMLKVGEAMTWPPSLSSSALPLCILTWLGSSTLPFCILPWACYTSKSFCSTRRAGAANQCGRV